MQKHKLSWVLDFKGCHLCRHEAVSYHIPTMAAHFHTGSVQPYFRGFFDISLQETSLNNLSEKFGKSVSELEGATPDLTSSLPAHVHFAVPPGVVSIA